MEAGGCQFDDRCCSQEYKRFHHRRRNDICSCGPASGIRMSEQGRCDKHGNCTTCRSPVFMDDYDWGLLQAAFPDELMCDDQHRGRVWAEFVSAFQAEHRNTLKHVSVGSLLELMFPDKSSPER
jgi:hypothetical protein